jgi:nitrogen regulatory protein P-II 1
MKKIEAIIRKSKFKEVKNALIEAGFESFNYNLTRCMSKESEKRYYRGVEFKSIAAERIDFAIYVNAKDVQSILDIILKAGSSGDALDSFINVLDVSQAYQIQQVDGTDKLISII